MSSGNVAEYSEMLYKVIVRELAVLRKIVLTPLLPPIKIAAQRLHIPVL
jgi:hypothetical protein